MAKIQLMTLDCSSVDYKYDDKKEKPLKIDDKSIDLNEQSLKKFREKMAKKQIEEAIPTDVTNELKNI